jgi:hypothetical protein
MSMFSLRGALAVERAERERLVEADDAIRDVLISLELCASQERLDEDIVRRASVAVLLAAAARQGVAAYADLAEDTLEEGLRALLADALAHERERARRAGAMRDE